MVRGMFQIATILLLFSASARAEVLFEGYTKIISGGVHVGYTVSRYEFDPAKKQFRGTYFLKTGALGSDITESVKSLSDVDFNPISYEYTSVQGKKTKTIDAKFAKKKMTAIVTEDGKTKTIRKDLPKDKFVFLSNFLTYVVLKKKGLQVGGDPYEYHAIAEEDAEVTVGLLSIESQENHRGHNAYRVLNIFKNVKFISYISDRGEALSTNSVGSGLGTELVARPSDAVADFGANTTILKSLFGEVPQGTTNLLSQAAKREALGEEKAPTKQQGVPGGQGILIKPAPQKGSSK